MSALHRAHVMRRQENMMPVFPSVEWFNAIKDMVNVDPAFRQLGTVDTLIGAKVGNKIYELTFEAFECANVREVAEKDLRDMDFWLEVPYETWKDMIENIKKNGHADLSHTLNTIKDMVNADPAFRQLGTVDTVAGEGRQQDL